MIDRWSTAFLRTRRVRYYAGGSVAAIALLELTFARGFAIPSIDYRFETLVGYLLAPLLGCLLAGVSNSVAPGMELLGGARLGRARTMLLGAVAVGQLALLLALVPLANGVLEADLTPERVLALVGATAFFQGLATLGAAAFTGYRVWIAPAVAASTCVLVGWAGSYQPRPWNLLVHASPASLAISCVLLAAGVLAPLVVPVGALERGLTWRR